MNTIATYIARDEMGNTYLLHKVPAMEANVKAAAPALPVEDQTRLVAADGREVQIVSKGVYDLVSAAAVVRVTCDDPDAP